METKAEKFERVLAPRRDAAHKALELMENLARSDYESTPARRREILEEIKTRFERLAIAWDVPDALVLPVSAPREVDRELMRELSGSAAAFTRKGLDVAIAEMKVDRALKAIEGLPEALSAMLEAMAKDH